MNIRRRTLCIRCKKQGRRSLVVQGRNLCQQHLAELYQTTAIRPNERRIADHIDGYDRDDLGESGDR